MTNEVHNVEKIWLDRGTYWLNTAPQSSPIWKDLRKISPNNIRVTCSNFGTAVGHSKFKTPEELADEMVGLKEAKVTTESRRVMDIGIAMEPIARNYYSTKYKVPVRELGLAVPKWDHEIGGSVDGEVVEYNNGKEILNGMIEIKCPETLYKPLKLYTNKISQGFKINNHNHIWPTHYDQMQGCMAICNKKWCDYVVFVKPEDTVFVQRIPFNAEYWKNELYPGIRHFIDNILKPRIKKKFGEKDESEAIVNKMIECLEL